MAEEKINELMSNEELEQVSGGNCYETSDDSRFLNVLLHETKNIISAIATVQQKFFSVQVRSMMSLSRGNLSALQQSFVAVAGVKINIF